MRGDDRIGVGAVTLLPPMLMLFAIGTERLDTTRLGAGTLREEDVKDFLDRVHRRRLTPVSLRFVSHRPRQIRIRKPVPLGVGRSAH